MIYIKKNIRMLAAPLLLCAACASTTTGVVSTGQNNFMISLGDNGPAASLGNLKAKSYREAALFCVAQGKSLKTNSEADTPRSFGRFLETTLHFTCI
jgi:hypothetical protein